MRVRVRTGFGFFIGSMLQNCSSKLKRGRRRSRDVSSTDEDGAANAPPCTIFDVAYFQSYSHLGIHEEMIKVSFYFYLIIQFLEINCLNVNVLYIVKGNIYKL